MIKVNPTPNNSKTQLQAYGVELSNKYPFIIFEWATGTGKSLVAINIIESSSENWNIVIAETNHELNWKEEFKKHGKESLLNKVKFFCYQSLHKHLDGENYIFDEVHHIQSYRRLSLLDIIKKNNLKKFVGLSATLTWQQRKKIESSLGYIHVHKIRLSFAIDNKILPEPKVYLVEINLDHITKLIYNQLDKEIESLKKLYFRTGNEWHKIKWLRTAGKRKSLLANYKTPFASKILNDLENKRLICFTASIAQSEELSNGLSVHSEISKKDREDLINKFNSGEIDKLFVTGMLREGQNLNNIEAGVVVQLDNNEKYFYQTQGRVLRSDSPEYYILYVKDTQDEVYLKNVLQDYDMKYVQHITM